MLPLVLIGKCHNPRQLNAWHGLLLTDTRQADLIIAWWNQNKTKELSIWFNATHPVLGIIAWCNQNKQKNSVSDLMPLNQFWVKISLIHQNSCVWLSVFILLDMQTSKCKICHYHYTQGVSSTAFWPLFCCWLLSVITVPKML